MTSTVTSKGQTVVPKPLRDHLHLEPGAKLEWRKEGETLRVKKVVARKRSLIEGLKLLGQAPEVPRDKRPYSPRK